MVMALSYEEYLAALPPDRRDTIDRVWQVVRSNMPEDYVEEIGPKFITFKVDEDWYVALANQKNYVSLYLMPVYAFPELKAKLDRSGKKLKTGKSCINFRRAEELPLDVIGEIISAHNAEAYKEYVRHVRAASKQKRSRKR
jgi:uncharacterized protein YdhG (YjbR/CyaY superfamily)